MKTKQSALFKKTGSFFAFGDKQLKEQAVKGVKYASMGAGLICPKANAKELKNGIDKIWDDAIKQDLEENGKDGIILRGLFNHECFYTGDPLSISDSMKAYGVADEEIMKVYNQQELKETE